MTIALLEDDASQRELLAAILDSAGYECSAFARAAEFLGALEKDRFELIILDWWIPDMTGLEVLKRVRARFGSAVPVLFTTVNDEERDLIAAFEAGADDFIRKPIRQAELIARIRQLQRRASRAEPGKRHQRIGPFEFDLRLRVVKRDDRSVDVTEKEFILALTLLSRLGQIVGRELIRESVWGRLGHVDSRTIDTHISRVRAKLGLQPELGFLLSPIYGVGYRIEQLEDGA